MVDTALTPRWDAISWDGDDRLSIDGINFWLTTTDYHTLSTRERFVLLKNRAVLDSYREVFELIPRVRNALELGFYHGASTVLYDRLLLPEKFVAVDHMPEAPFLEAYRANHRRMTLVPYYGLSQQDIPALTTIAEHEFPERNLDLVIDDASHEYEATRGALEVFWPFVRPGGVYVIEDWGWSHWPGQWQDANRPIIPGPALSNLVFELVMTQASRPDLIGSLHVDQFRVAVVRGTADVAPGSFVLTESYRTRGYRFSLLEGSPTIVHET